jgi:hypothetical protein
MRHKNPNWRRQPLTRSKDVHEQVPKVSAPPQVVQKITLRWRTIEIVRTRLRIHEKYCARVFNQKPASGLSLQRMMP